MNQFIILPEFLDVRESEQLLLDGLVGEREQEDNTYLGRGYSPFGKREVEFIL